MSTHTDKDRRTIRREQKQKRDRRRVGTQFTRSVTPYVRAKQPLPDTFVAELEAMDYDALQDALLDITHMEEEV